MTFARCCGPARPQAIMGYVTLVRGVTIHRGDCASLARMRALKPERVLAGRVDGRGRGRNVRAAAPDALAIHEVDGALVGGERRFMQRFSERRMRMHRPLQILAARRVLHGEYRFSDELARQRPDDMHA